MDLVFICSYECLETGRMPIARLASLESTAMPLLLLPALIAMRGILVVEGLLAAIHALHALLPVREAQLACVTRAILVMVLRAAIHALRILFRRWEAHPVGVMQVSAAMPSQRVLLASPGSTERLPQSLAQALAPAVSGRWTHPTEAFQTVMGITAQMQIAAGSLKHLALTFPWALMPSIPSLDMIL